MKITSLLQNITLFFSRILSCIKERRLPWKIYYPLLTLWQKIKPTPAGGTSHPTMDFFVEEQIKKINPAKIVDFGAGTGKYGIMLRKIYGKKADITAVEIFTKTCNFLKKNKIYNCVVRSSILDWLKNNKDSYDLAIFGDVLEHLDSKRDLRSVLDTSLNFFKHIIIVSPLGIEKQEAIGGNIYEEHKIIITEDLFQDYNVKEKNIKEVKLPPRASERIFKINLWLSK